MTTKIKKPILYSKETPRQIIFSLLGEPYAGIGWKQLEQRQRE